MARSEDGALIKGSWSTDSAVPEPSGLYHYVQALDSWVKGAPFDDPMIGGLIQVSQFGESAKRDFTSGRKSLWSLVPPIDALQIKEAELGLVGLRALTVPLTLRGRHALHHYLPGQTGGTPPLLLDVEFVVGFLLESLARSGEEAGSSSIRRLEQLLADVQNRSAPPEEDEAESTRLAIPKRKGRESQAVSGEDNEFEESASNDRDQSESPKPVERRPVGHGLGGSRVWRLALVILLLPVLASLSWVLPRPGGDLPSVSSYREVPLVAMVRMEGRIVVRAHSSWFTVPEEERSLAIKALWDRLVAENADPGLELEIADNLNRTQGGVVAGKVWWDAQVLTPTETETPSE